jgi:hypothetical protein
MSQDLLKLAEDLNLPALFCEQLQAGQRITMWSEELELVKPRVWGVYQDTPGRFSLQLKIQGRTSSSEDGWQLVPLPKDIAAAKAAGDNSLWEIGGYVVLHEEDLEPEVVAALNVLLEWTGEAGEILKSGSKPNYKDCPNLWFEPQDGDAGLQLLPKINKEGQLSFSGWAYRNLEWHGDGIRGRKVELNDYFRNGKPQPKKVETGAPISVTTRDIPEAPPAPKAVSPSEAPKTRVRAGSTPPEVPPKVDQSVLAANV